MLKTSKQLIAILLVVIACFSLAACHDNKDLEVASKTNMDVPEAVAAAKIYPYYDKSLETLVSYQSEEVKSVSLSDKDVMEITNKAEQYSALLCNDIPDDYDISSVDFLVNDKAEDIIQRAEKNDHTTQLQTCQILNLNIVNKNTVEATCIMTTKKDGEEVEYFDMAYLKFEKPNSKWYILGGQEIIYAPVSQYTISRDSISGKIIVEPNTTDNN